MSSDNSNLYVSSELIEYSLQEMMFPASLHV